MDELKLTGNCLKGSRPILSFDKVCLQEILMLMLFIVGKKKHVDVYIVKCS